MNKADFSLHFTEAALTAQQKNMTVSGKVQACEGYASFEGGSLIIDTAA